MVGYQYLPVSKNAIFDRQHPMFVGVNLAFDIKSEVSKYQNAMTLVAMEIEKYQWNVMVTGEPDNLDDSSFIRNIFLLVETQTMYMHFQLEV